VGSLALCNMDSRSQIGEPIIYGAGRGCGSGAEIPVEAGEFRYHFCLAMSAYDVLSRTATYANKKWELVSNAATGIVFWHSTLHVDGGRGCT